MVMKSANFSPVFNTTTAYEILIKETKICVRNNIQVWWISAWFPSYSLPDVPSWTITKFCRGWINTIETPFSYGKNCSPSGWKEQNIYLCSQWVKHPDTSTNICFTGFKCRWIVYRKNTQLSFTLLVCLIWLNIYRNQRWTCSTFLKRPVALSRTYTGWFTKLRCWGLGSISVLFPSLTDGGQCHSKAWKLVKMENEIGNFLHTPVPVVCKTGWQCASENHGIHAR